MLHYARFPSLSSLPAWLVHSPDPRALALSVFILFSSSCVFHRLRAQLALGLTHAVCVACDATGASGGLRHQNNFDNPTYQAPTFADHAPANGVATATATAPSNASFEKGASLLFACPRCPCFRVWFGWLVFFVIGAGDGSTIFLQHQHPVLAITVPPRMLRLEHRLMLPAQ